MEVSREYSNFLDSEKRMRKLSAYERICRFSESLLPISPGKDTQRKFQEAIDFAHLKITPKGSFSFSVITTLLLFVCLLITKVLGTLSFSLMFLGLILLIPVFYFLYNYPMRLLLSYKIKASTEMVLCTIYMSVSMKVRPNLENAVKFTAANLSGPLAIDLNELIWATYSGKYSSIDRALDDFIEKWKTENSEFTESMNLIKSAFFKAFGEREKVLDEAVSVVLEGTKDRMKRYSQDLQPVLNMLNALGILLPLIGMILFPMMSFFMPEAVKPLALILGYNIFLPIFIVFLMSSFLKKRPASFHQPEIIEPKKLLSFEHLAALLFTVLLGSFGLYKVLTGTEKFSFPLLMYSTLVTVAISGGIIIYCFLSTLKSLKLRNEIVQMESELGVVLFQLGYHVRGGSSIESSLEKITPRIKELKVHSLFVSTLNNINSFGLTFGDALFNRQNGVIYRYPSRLIRAVMNAVVEISKSGSVFLSSSLVSISNFLKNMNTVEEYLREILAEVTSAMKVQALMLAPLATGIVVALSALMMSLLVNLSEWIASFKDTLGGYGPIGAAGSGVFESLIQINQITPVHYFQIIVGVYMIEVVSILSYFLSVIETGDDKIMRRYTLGKMLLIATFIYVATMILLYSMMSSLIPKFGGF
ncbi:hypothetical protein A3K63_01340 [Candidatus Micrarchaeota archaeon RBG_16_49_10]|nr:MAG: hypothetical protein A3K63_01340 [Candidatus Micrarchaeota archaeon RBG_16_49_10]